MALTSLSYATFDVRDLPEIEIKYQHTLWERFLRWYFRMQDRHARTLMYIERLERELGIAQPVEPIAVVVPQTNYTQVQETVDGWWDRAQQPTEEKAEDIHVLGKVLRAQLADQGLLQRDFKLRLQGR